MEAEDGLSSDHVLYRDRPAWSDVRPVEQDDGPEPMVSIAYSDRYRDAMDYFRAAVQAEEYSERALQLVTDVIALNPVNYSAWQYRRNLLQALHKDLSDEFDYAERVALEQAKNYQVWYHRRVLVELTRDPSREKAYTRRVMEEDAKNYHAWSHRQWVVSEFGLWDGELAFVDQLLNEDVRNNSAWNHRHFVIESTTGLTEEVMRRELDYVLAVIRRVPNNESAWNYLRGIVLGGRLTDHPQARVAVSIKGVCDEMRSMGVPSPFLVETLADMAIEQAAGDPQQAAVAVQLFDELADRADPIRRHYWRYRRDAVAQDFNLTLPDVTDKTA